MHQILNSKSEFINAILLKPFTMQQINLINTFKAFATNKFDITFHEEVTFEAKKPQETLYFCFTQCNSSCLTLGAFRGIVLVMDHTLWLQSIHSYGTFPHFITAYLTASNSTCLT